MERRLGDPGLGGLLAILGDPSIRAFDSRSVVRVLVVYFYIG
jgi:hypothetical protein